MTPSEEYPLHLNKAIDKQHREAWERRRRMRSSAFGGIFGLRDNQKTGIKSLRWTRIGTLATIILGLCSLFLSLVPESVSNVAQSAMQSRVSDVIVALAPLDFQPSQSGSVGATAASKYEQPNSRQPDVAVITPRTATASVTGPKQVAAGDDGLPAQVGRTGNRTTPTLGAQVQTVVGTQVAIGNSIDSNIAGPSRIDYPNSTIARGQDQTARLIALGAASGNVATNRNIVQSISNDAKIKIGSNIGQSGVRVNETGSISLGTISTR
jgi:hypothetical protein